MTLTKREIKELEKELSGKKNVAEKIGITSRKIGSGGFKKGIASSGRYMRKTHISRKILRKSKPLTLKFKKGEKKNLFFT